MFYNRGYKGRSYSSLYSPNSGERNLAIFGYAIGGFVLFRMARFTVRGTKRIFRKK